MATVELHAMRRLSSSSTFFYKRIFPACWFGFLVVLAVTITPLNGETTVLIFLTCAFMALVGFTIMKLLVWRNVDEVWDAGDALLIRNRGEEDLVLLADVRNLTWSQWQNPETLTLMLSSPSRFGDEISFMLPTRWVPFGRHPVITELVERVNQARSAKNA